MGKGRSKRKKNQRRQAGQKKLRNIQDKEAKTKEEEALITLQDLGIAAQDAGAENVVVKLKADCIEIDFDLPDTGEY